MKVVSGYTRFSRYYLCCLEQTPHSTLAACCEVFILGNGQKILAGSGNCKLSKLMHGSTEWCFLQ